MLPSLRLRTLLIVIYESDSLKPRLLQRTQGRFYKRILAFTVHYYKDVARRLRVECFDVPTQPPARHFLVAWHTAFASFRNVHAQIHGSRHCCRSARSQRSGLCENGERYYARAHERRDLHFLESPCYFDIQVFIPTNRRSSSINRF